MHWMPSAEHQELYINRYLIDELRERDFLDFSERETLRKREERVEELERTLTKPNHKLSG